MTDLSAISDDDLMAMIGQSQAAPSSVSEMSDDALLAALGMQKPEAAPTPTGSKGGITGLFAQGIPFSDEIRAAASTAGEKLIKQPLDWITGANIANKGSWGEVYDQELGEARADEARMQEEYPVASVVAPLMTGAALPKLLMAGKAITPVIKTANNPVVKQGIAKVAGKAATEGGIYGGIYGFSEGEGGVMDRLETGAEGVALGAGLSGGASGAAGATGKVSGVVGSKLKEAGRKLELSAFGGTKNVIARLNEKARDLFDELGQYVNPLGEAIESFRNAGGGKAGMDGGTLVRELAEQTKGLNKQIATLLGNAEAKQTDAIIPSFNKTKEYVAGLAGVQKESAEAMAKDLINKTVNNTDGALTSLQAEKEKLSRTIAESAWGDDANPIQTNILKRIRSDLREAIEEGYAKLSGKPKTEIANLNAELGKRYALEKPIKDVLNSGESRDVLRSMIQTLRTSGGVGQTGIALAAGLPVGGLPLAGALAVGNLAAQTPSGKRFLADAFRSKGVEKITGAIAKAGKATADYAPRILGPLAGRSVEGSPASQSGQSDTGTQSRQLESTRLPSSNSITPRPPTQKGILGAPRSLFGETTSIFKGKPMKATEEQLVKAVIAQESSGNASAVSDKGATGLMQLMPETAKEIAAELGVKEYDLRDPETNLAFGTYYLNKLLAQFDGDLELALTAYHSGPNRVQKLLARTNGTKLSDIKKHLGPVGQKYAAQIIARLKA